MAGHNKWSKVKRAKAITDSRRGKVFSRLSRDITLTAKSGGGDPEANARLRTLLLKAREANMPAENIDRAIKKGTGELEGGNIEEVAYEGYGPGGAALFIEATTDNPHRTVADIRHAFSRNAGNLGATNSVAWMFDRKGQLYVDATRHDEERTLEVALEAGAEDFAREGDQYIISTAPNDIHAVQDAIRAKGVKIEEAELAMVPRNTDKVEGKDAEALLKLIEALEDLDDVSKVFSNFDIDSEMAEAAG